MRCSSSAKHLPNSPPVQSAYPPTYLVSVEKLVACGLLERHQYHDKPARYEYLPTAMGERLRPVLNVIKQFGQENRRPGPQRGITINMPSRRAMTASASRRNQLATWAANLPSAQIAGDIAMQIFQQQNI